jgi:hypothetical protein
LVAQQSKTQRTADERSHKLRPRLVAGRQSHFSNAKWRWSGRDSRSGKRLRRRLPPPRAAEMESTVSEEVLEAAGMSGSGVGILEEIARTKVVKGSGLGGGRSWDQDHCQGQSKLHREQKNFAFGISSAF